MASHTPGTDADIRRRPHHPRRPLGRLILCIGASALLLSCSDAALSPSQEATTTPIATADRTPSSSASGTPLPTLTPFSSPSADIGRWTPVAGSDLVPRGPVAVRAGDAGVLLLERFYCYGEPEGPTAAFYDGRTGRVVPLASGPGLTDFAVAALGDGRVIVAGGYDPADKDGAPTARSRIWSPVTLTWTEGPPMRVARSGHRMVSLAGGGVIAVGGALPTDDCAGCGEGTRLAEVFDPATERWTLTAPVELRLPDREGSDTLGDLVALVDGSVLAVGEYQLGFAAQYLPLAGGWKATPWQGGRPLVALPDGGAIGFGPPYRHAWLGAAFASRWDPSGTARVVAHWAPAWGSAVVALRDGRVLAAGGRVLSEGVETDYLDTAEILELDTGRLYEGARLATARSNATAILLADGSVLLVGGFAGPSTEAQGQQVCMPEAERVARFIP